MLNGVMLLYELVIDSNSPPFGLLPADKFKNGFSEFEFCAGKSPELGGLWFVFSKVFGLAPLPNRPPAFWAGG